MASHKVKLSGMYFTGYPWNIRFKTALNNVCFPIR